MDVPYDNIKSRKKPERVVKLTTNSHKYGFQYYGYLSGVTIKKP